MKEIQEMKILVVDDDKASLTLIKNILVRGGYKKIQTAGSGEEGFESMKNSLPDLILVDMRMPRMNGDEFCRMLKTKEVTKQIPVIMVTCSGEADTIKKSFDAGVIDYITKGGEPAVLLSHVEAALVTKRTYDQRREEMYSNK